MVDTDKKILRTMKSGIHVRIEYVQEDWKVYPIHAWRVYVSKGRNVCGYYAYHGHVVKSFFKAMRSIRSCE